MNDVGESTAVKAPNVDIRERVCGEHRPILLKGSEPSSEPFFFDLNSLYLGKSFGLLSLPKGILIFVA